MPIAEMMKPITDRIDKLEEAYVVLSNNHVSLRDIVARKSRDQTIINWLLIMWPAILIVISKWLF